MHLIARKLCLILIISLVHCSNVFEPCSLSDPNFNKCLKNVSQKVVYLMNEGIKEIGLESIEPYSLGDIKNANTATLNFQFTNIRVFGRNTTKINSIKLDPEKKIIEVSFKNDEVMKSKYRVNGTLLIIQVLGEGNCNIDILGAQYNLKIFYDVVKGNDGKDYWKITKHDSTLLPDRMKFEFENLFNGNKLLSDAVHRFANEYWKDILDEFGAQILNKITNKTVKQIGKLFAAIPAEKLIRP